MYEKSIEGSFRAKHRLRLASGQVEQLHSHDWRVEVCFAGPRLDGDGLLIDAEQARDVLRRVLTELDGRVLTDAGELDGLNPSPENLARWVFDRLTRELPEQVELVCVRVWESPGVAAAYRREVR